ncbi:hypothetical protein FAGKG844_10067 [Frankia sp. AgKG'84/4]|nr:pyridoxamine 5'-phosphate oxidase family protein [Frankia sp. AgKG'84/4]
MPTPAPSSAHLTPTRARDRFDDDLDRIRAVLDEARMCHVGVVVDAWPHVLPTLPSAAATPCTSMARWPPACSPPACRSA